MHCENVFVIPRCNVNSLVPTGSICNAMIAASAHVHMSVVTNVIYIYIYIYQFAHGEFSRFQLVENSGCHPGDPGSRPGENACFYILTG